MKASLEVYVSDWGTFVMPDGLSKSVKWETKMIEGWESGLTLEQKLPVNCEENAPFFSWLNEQELTNGKPG